MVLSRYYSNCSQSRSLSLDPKEELHGILLVYYILFVWVCLFLLLIQKSLPIANSTCLYTKKLLEIPMFKTEPLTTVLCPTLPCYCWTRLSTPCMSILHVPSHLARRQDSSPMLPTLPTSQAHVFGHRTHVSGPEHTVPGETLHI